MTGRDFMADHEAAGNFDQPGLGKSAQYITTVDKLHASGGIPRNRPSLVVTMNSLKYFWEQEIKDWTGRDAKVIVYEPWDSDSYQFWAQEADFFVIHWEALRFNIGPLARKKFATGVGDEGHKLKNRKSQQSQTLRKLAHNFERRYTLTASPIINRPEELWGMFNFLYPDQYTSYWSWFHENMLAQQGLYGGWEVIGLKNRDAFVAKLAEFCIRRLKRKVLPELPGKSVPPMYIPITITPEQRKVYEQVKKDFLATLPTGKVILTPTVLAQMIRLRQIACGLHLLDDTIPPSESAKLEACADHIEASDEPCVVFSQFIGMTRGMKQILDARKIPCCIVNGKDTKEPYERERLRLAFQETEQYKVFIATTQTMGVGQTLTRASTAHFLDQLWSPLMQEQAEDRLDRIGQKNFVSIIVYEAMNTVEQKVRQTLLRKGEIAGMVMDRGELEQLL
jgi:SNF2 family DNA or RNA helicase